MAITAMIFSSACGFPAFDDLEHTVKPSLQSINQYSFNEREACQNASQHMHETK